MIQSIDCTHARDLLIGALENEPLTETEHATLDAHLAECAGCRSYRQTMQHLAISLKAIPQVPVPAGLSERIMAQLAEETPAGKSTSANSASGHPGGASVSTPVSLNRWRRYAPIAAAVLVIAMAVPLAFFSMRQGPFTEHSEQELSLRGNNPPIHEQQPPADGFNTPDSSDRLGQGGFPPDGSNPNPPTSGYDRIANASPDGNHASSSASASPGPNGWSTDRSAASFSGNPAFNGNSGGGDSRGTAARGDTPSGGQAASTADAAGSELLAAADPSASMSATVSGETESDLYYDPVSTLVGF